MLTDSELQTLLHECALFSITTNTTNIMTTNKTKLQSKAFT
ncbi:hypothetical protein PROVALCAL_02148 [Providencia alcalifaciens DSM 30120]|uniref:Uncharacterized protein n=1 Tax=Providencia alcalifaciens DSM 30120 TaxID=520999 RepID=B6XFL7_9GAMM|nr:hypothetical protein PROVALCAL_02148 [Providencia alcalifaciens DSM 30120]